MARTDNGPKGSAPAGDIQVVNRCAQVLRMISMTQPTLRVAEVAAEIGLQRTTAHRYLASMAHAGMLERHEDGAYALGPLLVQLGTVALHHLRVLEIAGPTCQALADETNETVVVAVPGGSGPVVARVYEAMDRLVNIHIRVGSPLPIEAAQSLVTLAFAPDQSFADRLLPRLTETHRRRIHNQIAAVREVGYAINSQVVQGIRAMALPVLNDRGQVCATVALIGTVTSIPDDSGSGVLLATARAALQLSRDLGWNGTMPFQALLEPTAAVGGIS